MKRNLLKIKVLLIVLVCIVASSVQAINPVKTIELFYANGSVIPENGDVKLGSTIKVKVTTSTEPGDTKSYSLIFMQLGQLDNGVDKADAWINTYFTGGNPPDIVNGIDQIIEFDFPVKTTNNAGSIDVLPAASLFRVSSKESGNVNQEFVDHAVNFVAADTPDPESEVTDASFENSPNVTLGEAITFTANYTLVDDGVYQLWVMQNSLTNGTAPNKTWIKTTEFDLDDSGSITDQFITNTAKGGSGDPENDCIDGEGHFTFQLRKQNGESYDKVNELKEDAFFSTTPTSIVRASGSDFKLYPNPASSVLFVEATEGSVIEICNIAGSVVKTQVAQSAKQQISLTDLAKGMYVVNVKNNGTAVTQKLLVK